MIGLSPKHKTALGTSSDANAAGSVGLGGQWRSVRSAIGGTTGERSAAHPPSEVPDHKTGLSARRFWFDPSATKPADDPAVRVGIVPPKAPAGSVTSLQPPSLTDQALGASVDRSQPNKTAVVPLLAKLASPKVRGRLAVSWVQVTPPLVSVPRQTRGDPVTGLESTARRPSRKATTRPSPPIGSGSSATQVFPSAEYPALVVAPGLYRSGHE